MELIKEYKRSGLAILNANNIQLRKHKNRLDQFEDPYQVQENLVKESSKLKVYAREY